MPLLSVAVTGQPDPQRSAALADILTDLTNQHLGKKPALTAVAIHYLDPDHWAVGGKPLSKQNANSFSLTIRVTQGTNTKPQYDAYIDAVFAALSDLMGSVRDESYIIIEEIPAAAWGFGGRTQEHRYISGQVTSAA